MGATRLSCKGFFDSQIRPFYHHLTVNEPALVARMRPLGQVFVIIEAHRRTRIEVAEYAELNTPLYLLKEAWAESRGDHARS